CTDTALYKRHKSIIVPSEDHLWLQKLQKTGSKGHYATQTQTRDAPSCCHPSPRYRNLYDRGSGYLAQAQCQDHSAGYPEWQAQGTKSRTRLFDHRGSRAAVFRGIAVGRWEKERAVDHTYNSASSEVVRPEEADAAMDKPCHKYTGLPRRKQRLWTDRPSETPGLPSWAAGSGSGSVPSPFVTCAS